jgi:hypothetical protein
MAKITPEIEQVCIAEAHAYYRLITESREHERRDQRFTTVYTALKMLNNFPDEIWEDGKTFIDSECGIGQLIVPVAIIKRELGHSEILSCIYGTELLQENVDVCQKRLLDVTDRNTPNLEHVQKNIVCCDSLEYDFEFNG